MSKSRKKKTDIKVTWIEDMTISKEEKERRISEAYKILFDAVLTEHIEEKRIKDRTRHKNSQ